MSEVARLYRYRSLLVNRRVVSAERMSQELESIVHAGKRRVKAKEFETVAAATMARSYLLSVPYSDDREIVGDIMRFGADVEVLEPKAWRSKVQRGVLERAGRYV